MGGFCHLFNNGCLCFRHLQLVNWVSPLLTINGSCGLYNFQTFMSKYNMKISVLSLCSALNENYLLPIFLTPVQVNFICCWRTSNVNTLLMFRWSTCATVILVLHFGEEEREKAVCIDITTNPAPVETWWEESGDYQNAD